MKIEQIGLTAPLAAWIASRGEGRDLLVRQEGADVLVTRPDGSELLPSEVRRVEGVLAAHAAKPFRRVPAGYGHRRSGGAPICTPETAAARAAGRVTLRLSPEEAQEWRAWADEFGGLAPHARWLLKKRRGGRTILLELGRPSSERGDLGGDAFGR